MNTNEHESWRFSIRSRCVMGMFNEGDGEHARDPMILPVGDRYHCYYTAHSTRSPASNHRGVNYCRISTDLREWGPSKIIAEGSIYGKGPYCAECPHVVYQPQLKYYYLFNTQRYGRRQQYGSYCCLVLRRLTEQQDPDRPGLGGSERQTPKRSRYCDCKPSRRI